MTNRHRRLRRVLLMGSAGLPLLLATDWASAQQIQWKPLGPGGGGAWRSAIIDPVDDRIVLFSSDVSGIYRTTNAGESWACAAGFDRPDLINKVQGTMQLAWGGREWVYCTTEAGIMRSLDGGISWEHRPFYPDSEVGEYWNRQGGVMCAAISVDPDDPATVWVGSGIPRNHAYGFVNHGGKNRIWRTRDAFETADSLTFVAGVNPDSVDLDGLVVASFIIDRTSRAERRRILATTGTGLYESIDHGDHWEHIPSVWIDNDGEERPWPSGGVRNTVHVPGEPETPEDDILYTDVVSHWPTFVELPDSVRIEDQASWQGGIYRSLDWGRTWQEWNGTEGPQMLLDGGFESGSLERGAWVLFSAPAVPSGTVEVVEDAGYVGDYGLRIRNPEGADSQLGIQCALDLPVEAGARYAFGAWVQKDVRGTLLARVDWRDKNGGALSACGSSVTFQTAINLSHGSRRWRFAQGVMEAPPGAAFARSLRIHTTQNVPGDVYLDEVSFRRSDRLPDIMYRTDVPYFADYRCIQVHPDAPEKMYVSVAYGMGAHGVWGSADGGLTWRRGTRRPQDCEPHVDEPFRLSTGITRFHNHDWALAVGGDRENPTVIYGGSKFAFRTDDGGWTWRMNDGHANEYSSLVSHGHMNNIFVLDAAIHPTNPDRLYFTDADNLLLWSDNGGESWFQEGAKENGYNAWSSDSATSVRLDPADPDVVWLTVYPRRKTLAGPGGSFYRGIWPAHGEGRPSWEKMNDESYPSDGGVELVIDPVSDLEQRRFFAAVWGRGVFQSLDGGVQWTSLGADGDYAGWAPPPSAEINDGALCLEFDPHRRRLYAGFSNNIGSALYGGLWISDDAGANWTEIGHEQLSRMGIEDISILQGGAEILVATFEGNVQPIAEGQGGIWRGTEVGPGQWTWEHVLAQPKVTDIEVSPHHPSVIYAAASQTHWYTENQWAGIYRSSDAGTTWTWLQNDGLRTLDNVNLYLSPHDSARIYAGPHGSGFYEGTVVDCDLEVGLSGHPPSIDRGEKLVFRAEAINPCAQSRGFDRAVMHVSGPVSPPDHTLYQGGTIVVPADQALGASVVQPVPSGAPVGSYTIEVEIERGGQSIDVSAFDIDVE